LSARQTERLNELNMADESLATAQRTLDELLSPTGSNMVEVVADKFQKGRFTGKFTPKETGDHRVIYQPSDAPNSVEGKLRVMPPIETNVDVKVCHMHFLPAYQR
jgi:hypothetical protein